MLKLLKFYIRKDNLLKSNDLLITLESDKSSVEVPSTHEGVIKISVKIGDKVNQGDFDFKSQISK